MATKTKSAKKPATKRNVWPMSGTGKGYRGGDPLPSTQFKPMGDEKAARSMVRLLEAEGKVATAEKRGKVWGVSRPQGLVIGAWKKTNPVYGAADGEWAVVYDYKKGRWGEYKRFKSQREAQSTAKAMNGARGSTYSYHVVKVEKGSPSFHFDGPVLPKSNPASDAADMYDSFHGLPSEEDLTFFEDHHYHSNLAALGVLIELKVKTVNGDKTVISFDRGDDYRETMANPGHPSGLSWMDAIFPSRNYLKVKTFKDEYSAQKLLGKIESQGGAGRVDRVGRIPGRYQYEVWQLRNARPATKNGKAKQGPIAKAAGVVKSATDWVDSKLVGNPGDSKDPTTILCSNEKGTQLYFIGGDQAIKLSDLDITGPMADKESVLIGQVTNITYHTTKKFGAKPETFDYVHKFSEDSNGPLPQLVYDRLNERLSLVGGVYYIEKPMLGTSPGIED